ncbi:hypothetical protein [Nodularia sp. NIES-3585]|uniref:hypothetical protein n=1 Tax=Nodularia sp. NIES-3585 TaxID=1973477 RepID=UPI000B5C8689|nr:hypothetical protein [Nodularia sp. NIES-3585]GAX39018.1 hypothetical protein NIES3585_50700 [Nodularia sp. NIES-3585]
MTKFYNNVKVRLNRKGIKGISKAEYLVAAEHLGISDLDDVTTEQIIAGVGYLMDKFSNESASLSPSDLATTQTEEVSKIESELEQLEETALPTEHSANIISESTALDFEENLEEDIAHETTEPQPSIEQSEMQAMPAASVRGASRREAIACEDDPPEATAIELQETSELVASTAESMGIALNIEDVTAIASNFDYASTNSDDELEEIKAAITAFVQHKAALSRQKIKHIVQEVKETIHNLDSENSELLNDGLRSISQDIKSGSERFRQQTRQALKAFALPPSKAG